MRSVSLARDARSARSIALTPTTRARSCSVPAQTDVDCGGPYCGACAVGLACETDDDCMSDTCLTSLTMPLCVAAPTSAPTPLPTSLPSAAPTPVPSLSCPGATHIYRLYLEDTGGDGWQGASYRLYNATDYPNITMTASSMVANGTLADGSEDMHWLCLGDGCYEIVVDGGTADSEIGFEFVDEIGGHFADFAAPYADHMCVAAGDVFDHPTVSPTVSPTPVPVPLPTMAPVPAPTAGFYVVQAVLGFAGLSCDDYDLDAEAAVISGVADTITGVYDGDISSTGCSSTRRRLAAELEHGRRTQTSSATITLDITLGETRASALGWTDADSAASSISTTLDAAATDGSLLTAIQAALPTSVTTGLAAATSMTASALVETSAPTPVPTPVPVQKKKSSDTANLDLGLGLGLPLSFIFVTAIILGLYYRKQQLEKSDAGAGVGTPEDGFMAAPGDAPLAIEEDHIQLETAVHPGTGIPLVLEC